MTARGHGKCGDGHAPAPPESAVLAGGKKADPHAIKRAICKTGKLGKSCYPTNLRVTNPSLFRQSVGRNASMPVVPAPAPTHQRHGVAGVRVVLPPWPRCALRVISSRRGFHSMCIPALRRARIEQRALEPDFDPPSAVWPGPGTTCLFLGTVVELARVKDSSRTKGCSRRSLARSLR